MDKNRCKHCNQIFNGTPEALTCSNHCNNKLLYRDCQKFCNRCYKNKYETEE